MRTSVYREGVKGEEVEVEEAGEAEDEGSPRVHAARARMVGSRPAQLLSLVMVHKITGMA